MLEDLLGQTLDRYEIVRKLGEDDLGVEFLAHERTLQRDFRVKVFLPAVTERPVFRENFSQAARRVARLDHPNLIEVFDFGEANGYHYVVFDRVAGKTLAELCLLYTSPSPRD